MDVLIIRNVNTPNDYKRKVNHYPEKTHRRHLNDKIKAQCMFIN